MYVYKNGRAVCVCVIFNSLRSDGDRGTFGSARECSRCGLSVMGLCSALYGASRGWRLHNCIYSTCHLLTTYKTSHFMCNAINELDIYF
jgi:hypothetical protein